MTFLALDAQKSLFTLQKSQLEFEQAMVLSQASWCQKQMNYVTQSYSEMYPDGNAGDPDPQDDPFMIELQQMEEQLQTRQSNLDSQIKLLEQAINAEKTQIQNNIKASCGLNLIGG